MSVPYECYFFGQVEVLATHRSFVHMSPTAVSNPLQGGGPSPLELSGYGRENCFEIMKGLVTVMSLLVMTLSGLTMKVVITVVVEGEDEEKSDDI